MNHWFNHPDCYGTISKAFHWSMALCIIAMLIMGDYFNSFPKDIRPLMYNIHKSTGLFLLALVVLRIIWRVLNKQPHIPLEYGHIIRWSGLMAHAALYALMIAMPLSGWLFANPKHPLMVFGWFEFPHLTAIDQTALRRLAYDAHGLLANAFIIMIGLHVAAALFHHFILKDTILKRMISQPRH